MFHSFKLVSKLHLDVSLPEVLGAILGGLAGVSGNPHRDQCAPIVSF
jgi:hypothetical protein